MVINHFSLSMTSQQDKLERLSMDSFPHLANIRNVSDEFCSMNGPNKLECLSLASLTTFQPSVMQHSSQLDPFISYKENEVFSMQPIVLVANIRLGWSESIF